MEIVAHLIEHTFCGLVPLCKKNNGRRSHNSFLQAEQQLHICRSRTTKTISLCSLSDISMLTYSNNYTCCSRSLCAIRTCKATVSSCSHTNILYAKQQQAPAVSYWRLLSLRSLLSERGLCNERDCC